MPSSACLFSLHPPHSPGQPQVFDYFPNIPAVYFPKTAGRSLKSGEKWEKRYSSQTLCVWFSLYSAVFIFIFPFDFSAELEFRSVSRKWVSRIPSSQGKNSSSVENSKDIVCNSKILGVRWGHCGEKVTTAWG